MAPNCVFGAVLIFGRPSVLPDGAGAYAKQEGRFGHGQQQFLRKVGREAGRGAQAEAARQRLIAAAA